MRAAGEPTSTWPALQGGVDLDRADIAQVSKAIGHKSIAVTSDLYGSQFDAAQRELAEQAADVVPRQRARRSG